jgi:hypothetical protein
MYPIYGKSGYKSENRDEMDPPPQHRRATSGSEKMGDGSKNNLVKINCDHSTKTEK